MDARMKLYTINGRQCWYWPQDAPEGAEEVKAKAKATSNKAKAAANKAAAPAATK